VETLKRQKTIRDADLEELECRYDEKCQQIKEIEANLDESTLYVFGCL